jgi:hypothetical protein
MSIRPIDIQTLLMQMSQVGKDKAIEKDGALLQAAIKGAEEQKRRDESKEAVRRPEEADTEAPPVKERNERGGGSVRDQGGRSRNGEDETPKPPANEGEEVVRDPDLGTKLDISG